MTGLRHGPPRRRVQAGALAALTLPISLALSACSSTPAGGPTTTSGGSGSSAPTTVTSGPWTSCIDVPLATIKATVGLSVDDPQPTGANRTSTCGYSQSTGASSLVVQVVSNASGPEFTRAVDAFRRQGATVAALTGLGAQAASMSSSSVVGTSTTTVMAREGTAQVLVAAAASESQVAALVKAILAKA